MIDRKYMYEGKNTLQTRAFVRDVVTITKGSSQSKSRVEGRKERGVRGRHARGEEHLPETERPMKIV